MTDIDIVDIGGGLPSAADWRAGQTPAERSRAGQSRARHPRAEHLPEAPSPVGSGADDARTDTARPLPLLPAAAAVMVASALALVAGLQWQHRSRTVTTVRSVPVAVPVTVDAIGCPLPARCQVSNTALPNSWSAVQRWNAGARLDSGTVVYDDEGTPVHSSVIVEVGTPAALVTVVSQCVPHGSAVAASVRAEAAGVVAVTVPGRRGCSVVVTGPLEIAALSRLAHAPALQL